MVKHHGKVSASTSARAMQGPATTGGSGSTRKKATRRWDQGFVIGFYTRSDGHRVPYVPFAAEATAHYVADRAEKATKSPMIVFPVGDSHWGYTEVSTMTREA